jgi:hypothetical protein
VGIRCADHVTPSTRKSRHYFADSGGRSVGIVRLRIKATESILQLYSAPYNRSPRKTPDTAPLRPPQTLYNPTWDRTRKTESMGKPATNRLSYGMAVYKVWWR